VEAPHLDRGPDAADTADTADAANTADFYVARRQLGWLGHVARMDYSRLLVGCYRAGWRTRGRAAPRA